jgi:ParB family chromosome partitioning protein
MGDVGAETDTRTRAQSTPLIEYVRPNPRNPRRNSSEAELDDLAASIKERGIIQPVVVRSIAGAKDALRSLRASCARAAQRAGLHDVPIVLSK